jgi:hypothetical protein
MSTVLIVLLILLLLGGLPTWGIHSYGYAPSGLLLVLLIIVLVLAFGGRL